MAIKFRRVKRPARKSRRRSNPAGRSLLVWGLAGLGLFLLVKKMKATSDRLAALQAATAPQLTQQVAPPATAADPSVTEAIQGVGGIFSKGGF